MRERVAYRFRLDLDLDELLVGWSLPTITVCERGPDLPCIHSTVG